jgi:hypothetical protein
VRDVSSTAGPPAPGARRILDLLGFLPEPPAWVGAERGITGNARTASASGGLAAAPLPAPSRCGKAPRLGAGRGG